MRLNVYSIYDLAAVAYTRPFFMQADSQARRMFGDIAMDAEHEVGKHPEDYSLVRIGIFDDQNAKLIPEDVETLATGLEMVAAGRQVTRENLELFDNDVEQGSYGGTK